MLIYVNINKKQATNTKLKSFLRTHSLVRIMFEETMIRKISFALTLVSGYFLTALLAIHVYIFGALIGLAILRLQKFIFGVLSGSSNKGA